MANRDGRATTTSAGEQRSIPEVLRVRQGHDEDWDAVADHVLKVDGKPILQDWGLRLLRRGLEDKTASVIVEPSYICKDHRDLFSNYYSRKFRVNEHLCSRLHFFASEIPDRFAFLEKPDDYTGSYIGFSVIRPIPERCIGRSVWDPKKLGIGYDDDLFCLRTRFMTHLLGVSLSVRGYPYMAQDDESIICGHAALWGLCRYLSERYTVYPEVLPYDLIRMTGNEEGRTCPRHGLFYRDYSRILTDFGCHPVIIETKQDPQRRGEKFDVARFRDICTYVESGFPVLASVLGPKSKSGHALALIGHTFDRSIAKPDADGLVDHTSFFKQLVVVDDNAFPYRRLGREGDPENYTNSYRREQDGFHLNSLHHAICPLPEKVFLTADAVRPMISSFLKDKDVWPEIKKTGQGPWVTRLFLTTGYSFKSKKILNARKFAMGEVSNLDYIVSLVRMPHFVWVMQVGPWRQYVEDLRCTAEIVVDATAGKNDTAVLYVRVGDRLLFPGSEKYHSCAGAEQNFELYRHNLGDEMEE